MKITFKQCRKLIKQDYERLDTKDKGFLYNLFLSVSFKQTFWFRILNYLTFCDKKILWPFKVLTHLYYRHVSLLHGISLDRVTKVGGG